MEKLYIKKLDDGKEFKIIFKLMSNMIAVPFETLAEYLGIDSNYWKTKLEDNLLNYDNGGHRYIYLSTFQYHLPQIKPRSYEGKYWKKVISDLKPGEMLFYNIGKNQENKTINAKSERISQEIDLKESKDQLDLVRIELIRLKLELASSKDNINFLEAKNKDLKKQQRKLNQSIGIDLLNMAQSLLNMKEY